MVKNSRNKVTIILVRKYKVMWTGRKPGHQIITGGNSGRRTSRGRRTTEASSRVSASATKTAHPAKQVEDTPFGGASWWLDWDSNLRPSGLKAPNLPQAPQDLSV